MGHTDKPPGLWPKALFLLEFHQAVQRKYPMNKTLPRLALAALAMPALTLGALADTSASAPAPVIDNTWVSVRDIQLAPGMAGPALTHAGDYAVLYISGGKVQSNGVTTAHEAGSASFGHGGTVSDTAVDGPVHEVVIDLKDAPSGSVPNTTGLPNGFPRPGSKKVFENSRVIVWNYTWLPGKPTPMHFHDKNVVVVYAGNGPLKGVSPDGKEVVNNYKAGEIRFNTANRAHYEVLTEGEQSAVMMELK